MHMHTDTHTYMHTYTHSLYFFLKNNEFDHDPLVCDFSQKMSKAAQQN